MALRVIAGSAGGVPLACPHSGNVRPTMDQVRGAIFSSLAASVPGSQVLDLFAGAGTLGIEALSRGARKATFVERDRKTLDCLRSNLAKTHLATQAELICLDAFSSLARLSTNQRFDLIFADPPYTTTEQPEDFATRLVMSRDLSAILLPGGVLILEKSPRQILETAATGWEIIRQKRYGATEVVFLTRSADAK